MESKNILTEDTIIEVWNNGSGSVGYTTDTITRVWNTLGDVKKVKLGELREATNTTGGRSLFENGILLIKNSAARDFLGLALLDNYLLNKEEIVEMLKREDLKEIEDFLQYCPINSLLTLAKLAIELPIKSLEVGSLIEDYSGFEVIKSIKERAEDSKQEEEKNPTPGQPRRVKRTE